MDEEEDAKMDGKNNKVDDDGSKKPRTAKSDLITSSRLRSKNLD